MTTTNDTSTLDSINLGSLDFWAEADIHAALATLRREAPVTWHEHPDSGKGFWSVTRHADIAQINGEMTLFSNREGIRINHDKGMGLVRPGTDSIIEMDPPQHTVMRKIVARGFTPRSVGRFEGLIRQRSRSIIQGVASRGSCDFVADLAVLLPLHIICDIVGVPEEDREYVFDLTNRSLGENDPALSQGPEYGSAAAAELKAYGRDLGVRRIADPKDDLVTDLMNADVSGRALTPDELGGFFSLLIAAGNETTRNALSFGMHGFSEFPEQRDLFVRHHEFGPSAAEEIVRWASPLMHMRRTLTADTTFRGADMKKGDKVVLWYISSNRDEEIFEDPHRFDITRSPNLHQAFGGGGAHFCLGSNLAKLEIIVFFQELFAMLPDIHTVEEPVRLRSSQFRGVSRLNVEFTPR